MAPPPGSMGVGVGGGGANIAGLREGNVMVEFTPAAPTAEEVARHNLQVCTCVGVWVWVGGCVCTSLSRYVFAFLSFLSISLLTKRTNTHMHPSAHTHTHTQVVLGNVGVMNEMLQALDVNEPPGELLRVCVCVCVCVCASSLSLFLSSLPLSITVHRDCFETKCRPTTSLSLSPSLSLFSLTLTHFMCK